MSALSRRSFLAAGAGLLVSSSIRAAQARPFFDQTGLPLGLQLYTVREDLKKDFDATLSAISRIGYKTVELAGFFDRSPQVWRQALDRAGLRSPSAHIPARSSGPEASLSGDLAVLADQSHTIGIDTLVCPMINIPERFSLKPAPGEAFGAMLARIATAMTVDDWKWNADFLNDKAAALKRLGLHLAYHNHNFECAPLADSTGFDLLLRGTDPALVSFEMDAGWVVAAGADPVALLKRYPNRFTAMHVKDIKASTRPNFSLQQVPCEVGRGMIDWKTLLTAAHAAGVRQFYVEQEPPFTSPPLEAVAISFNYLHTLVA
jgi:sugar phosphate isomerase/epimerase